MKTSIVMGLSHSAVFLFLVAGLFLTHSAYADRMGMGGYYGQGMMNGPFNKLNLSETQRKQIHDIQREARKQQWDLMDKMYEQHLKISELMNAEKRNARAIVAAYAPIYKLHEQMVRNAVSTANRIDEVLTPEQRKEFNEWRDDMHKRFHDSDDDDRHHRGMIHDGDHMGRRGMMDSDSGCGGYGGMGMMGGYGGMGMMGGYGGMGMLNLTGEQREKISAIQNETHEKRSEIIKEMQEAREKISKLMHSESRDADAIVAAHRPIYKLNDKMVEIRVKAANKIDAILTQEQRQELREWQERSRKHHGMGKAGMMMW